MINFLSDIYKKIASIFIFFIFICPGLYATSAEIHTSTQFDLIKGSPKLLEKFLSEMPKGGDLHNHLSGASYAENLLSYAEKEEYCFLPATLSVYLATDCVAENYLQEILKAALEKERIIDAWSMRNFDASKGERPDEHFFATFAKFNAISSSHKAEMLAEVLERAALQNELYLEVMLRADDNIAKDIGLKLPWDSDFDQMRDKLKSLGIDNAVNRIHGNIKEYQDKKDRLLGCNTATAKEGCKMHFRIIHEVQRENEPSVVFSQLLASFEAAKTNPQIAAVNLIQAENGPLARRDYHLHMQMMAYFHTNYPDVHISLHAGELTGDIAPAEDLKSHISQAITIAKAERIGHGVDVLGEENVNQLLTDMANKHILVEINLSSNDYILQLRGSDHPLSTYLASGIPIALSTDDEGVNRSNLSQEYKKAVIDHQLNYPQLKIISRNSLHYSFAKGLSLFKEHDYQQIVDECAGEELGGDFPASVCKDFLQQNEKAALQWELEKRFKTFESNRISLLSS